LLLFLSGEETERERSAQMQAVPSWQKPHMSFLSRGRHEGVMLLLAVVSISGSSDELTFGCVVRLLEV
jgi:hypothetical protein